jgi:hypothetical protein
MAKNNLPIFSEERYKYEIEKRQKKIQGYKEIKNEESKTKEKTEIEEMERDFIHKGDKKLNLTEF